MPRLARLLDRLAFGLALALLLVPGAVMLASVIPVRSVGKLAISRLKGATAAPTVPPIGLSSVLDRSVQGGIEAYLANRIGRARDPFIRLHNGIEYAAGRSPVPSVLIGRNRTLYERHYVDDWCGAPGPVEIGATVDVLGQLAERLRSRGQAFVLVISPSKAAIYPDLLPPGCVHGDRRPYDDMVAALRGGSVPFVDGSALLKARRDAQPWPVFGRTGTHWNELGATFVTEAVLAEIARQRPGGVRQVGIERVRVDDKPFDEEKDLADLLNLPVPIRVYPSPHPVVGATAGPPVRLLLSGSSFGWQMLRLLTETGVLADGSRSYFYLSRVTSFRDGRLAGPGGPGEAPADLAANLPEAEALVIEANEAALGSGHLLGTARAALAVLDRLGQAAR